MFNKLQLETLGSHLILPKISLDIVCDPVYQLSWFWLRAWEVCDGSAAVTLKYLNLVEEPVKTYTMESGS